MREEGGDRQTEEEEEQEEEEGASSSAAAGHTDTDRLSADHGASAAASELLQPDTEAADPAADTEPWPLRRADPRPAPAPACCSRSARSPTCRWTR